MTVALGYIHGQMVHARFMKCVTDLQHYDPSVTILETEGNNPANQRNQLVKDFLNTECEWLYFADTDTVFAPNIIHRLLAHTDPDHMIVSGLIYVDGRPPFPMMYRRVADIASGNGPFGVFQSIAEWKREDCIRVDAVGGGCLLVHRDVYLEIEKKLPNRNCTWFEYANFAGMAIGEDITFCMRAADIGHKIWVDTSTRVGHIKPRVILCSHP
jgi:GT2 family glycosyltransferase